MVNVSDLLTKLSNGFRMERPKTCPEEYYAIMLTCWQQSPSKRPSFSELAKSIHALRATEGGEDYLEPSRLASEDCLCREGSAAHPNTPMSLTPISPIYNRCGH